MCLLVSVSTGLLSRPAAAAGVPCEPTDFTCLQRVLLEKADECDALRRQLSGYQQLDDNSQKQIKLLQESNVELANALKPALDAVRAAQPKFYQTVEFGLVIGVSVGVLLTALAGFTIAYVARNLVVPR